MASYSNPTDKERIRINNRKSYLNNRASRLENQTAYYNENKEAIKQRVKIRSEICPWLKTYSYIWDRINNKGNKSYRFYGGRGIKLIITRQELEILWYRDKADEMQLPTIDRIDSNGHYEFNNCRYIEHNENKRTVKTHCLRGHSLENAYNEPNKNNYMRRRCRECRRTSALASYYRNKEKNG